MLTAILVPVGMGYAEAAGLPAINGLYATIACRWLRMLSSGRAASWCWGRIHRWLRIIAATIVPLAAGDPDYLVALAGMLALFTGALCILAGLARFGFITDLLSKPIRLGYLNGIALTVIIGQLPKILGFPSSGDNLIQETISLIQGIAQGKTNWAAVAIGVACLAVILVFKRRWPKIPGVLIAVVGATIVVGVFDLAAVAGVSVVGPLPQGLPSFQVPRVSADDLAALMAGAVAIALVAFADTSVLSRTFALRGGYQVDQNQEMIALGAANVAAGFFQGFSDQQQLIAHPGGGTGGREDATDRRGGRVVHRAAAGVCADAAAEPAQRRPGRRRDLGVPIAGEISRASSAVSSASRRVRAVDRLFSRRRADRRDPGHLHRRGGWRCSASSGARGGPTMRCWAASMA